MIIHALNDYYNHLVEEPDSNIAHFGFTTSPIHFALILDTTGKLVDVNDLRSKENNKMLPEHITVPFAGVKTSGIVPSFLWGSTGYVLGRDTKEKESKKRARILQQFESFKKFQHLLGDGLEVPGIKAILRFLDSWNPNKLEQSKCSEYWQDMAGKNIVFRLDGEARHRYVHDHPVLQDTWKEYRISNSSDYEAFCLVSGKKTAIAKLHEPKIKGVLGAQLSGASLVSFNIPAFCSYQKAKSFNAPVSEEIAFNYSTALNHLLRSKSKNKVQLGNITVVFWGEDKTPLVGFLKDILTPAKESSEGLKDVRRFLDAIREGKKPKAIENSEHIKFYILGLSPNSSRLAVRFWHVNTVESLSKKIMQHYDDLEIVRDFHGREQYFGIWHLIAETAVERRLDNASPLLAGSLMKSIITGAAYPIALFSAILRRIKADREINFFRASLIKAYLVRKHRLQKQDNKEVVSMALNREETNVGYILGRLFAVLEKAQQGANPKAKSTIKDRFYGAASVTPSVVFPQLLRLAQHHIQKSEYGVFIDKQIEEITEKITRFPAHLNLDEQGFFAIGYYHQKQDFYKKKEKEEKTENAKSDNEQI